METVVFKSLALLFIHFDAYIGARLITKTAARAVLPFNKKSRTIAGFVEVSGYSQALSGADSDAERAAFTFVRIYRYFCHFNIFYSFY
jgi:hypothetical protein